MTGRLHVKLEMDLFIDNEQAMRIAAFERLQQAWTSDDEFPYSSAPDVPFEEVVNSLLADAVSLDLPGCRRSSLGVEVGGQVEELESDDASEAADGSDQEPASESDGSQDEKGAEREGGEGEGSRG